MGSPKNTSARKSLLIFFLSVPFFAGAQNVGIGTITPQTRLHVYDGASGALPFAFSPLAVESDGHTYINILSPAANETAILFGKPDNSASGVIMYNNENTPNGFQFRNNGNLTRMVINNAGNIGIGITNPLATLDVAGSIQATGLVTMNSLKIVSGGQPSDFLIKNDAEGTVNFRKGHTGLIGPAIS